MNATVNDISRFYDGWMNWPILQEYYGHSGFFNVGYWQPDTRTQTQACENLMEQLLNFLPAKQGTILDVACGLGGTTRHLLRHYPAPNVVGINISETQLERCRLNVPECAFYRMDATSLDFDDTSFDSVVCVEAAFHFNTRQQFLHEAQRVLKPGGFLVLSDMFFASELTLEHAILPGGHLSGDVDAYADLYRQAGFELPQVVDATEQCSSAFRQHVLSWAQGMAFVGAISEQNLGNLVRAFSGFAISHYLLVAARKPAPLNHVGVSNAAH